MSWLKAWIGNSFVACLFLCIALQPFATMAEVQGAGPPNLRASEGDIQQAIHDYILAHPEVIIKSLQLAKQKERERQAAVAQSLIEAHRKDLIEDPNAPTLGNPNGEITVVEFFDYRCPYCRQMDPLLQKLASDDPRVRIVQKQFPILGPPSVLAARVALAANKQGKHREFHNALMAKRTNLDEAGILSIAETVGLDIGRLKVDMASREVDAEILNAVNVAKELNLTGTPAFIVGSELIPGATDFETLKALVDDARQDSK